MQEPQHTLPKLLVVDDQVINIQTLYQLFSADYAVFQATSGQQALDFCATHAVDLVLLDVMMPGMDGLEVCRRLKSDPRTQGIPVIFVTAQNNPEEEAIGLQVGAVDFISRPLNAVVVRARVQTHLLLHQLKDGLERKVQERTAQLESALQRLQESQDQLASSEAKATLSTLVASVSHELGTPIGNSRIAADTLADQARAFDRLVNTGGLKRSDLSAFVATVGTGTDMIQRNLNRASDLLTRFRQVAADQASEQRREFDLADTVQEILDTLAPSLKRHPHRVVLEIAPGIVMDSQPGPLGQIVINLINNAYLHAFEHRDDGVLTLSAEQAGRDVILRFTDNGVGMSDDNLSKLFEPFFSTKIGKGGTGLGMAIVKNLVCKTLGGSIEVHSTLGRGTQFEIRLPRVIGDGIQ